MNTDSAPIQVLLRRDTAESEHRIDAAVVDGNGLVAAYGDHARPTIPRSSIKPIQVLPLIRTGAAEAFSVSDVELTLGAASHSGEAEHVTAVDAWLERIGLDRSALECGSDRPISVDEADRLLRDGQTFGAIHNCCSGKHAGFLTIAQHLGVDPAGYIHREHPVQQLVTAAIAEFTGVDVDSQTSGIDGCGIPTFSIPLDALARSMSALVTSDDPAAQRVASALGANAFWISGTDRMEVRVCAVATEPVVLKAGAEGVYMAALPDRGIGIALKTNDGASRAAEIALAGILEQLGVIPEGLATTDVTNKAGTVVGTMQVQMP